MSAPDRSAARVPGGHTPVMLREVLDVLAPRDGAIYVDGTFGGGGYAAAILDAAACTVWAIDRDAEAIAAGQAMVAAYSGRLVLVEGRFGAMDRLLAAHGVHAVDGIALDLGVSSWQLDQAQRGFSFVLDGPLDMRMEQSGSGPSAADVVNALSESELADLIDRFGEERRARQVARAIVGARRERPIARTGELAAIVRKAVRSRAGKGASNSRGRIDPATRTFQALRIYVNDELGELGRGLAAAERLLAPGGRLAVLSFHSLEDRVVKRFLRESSGDTPRRSRHAPESSGADRVTTFKPLHRGACRPSRAECVANARARSARLRAAIRTEAPATGSPVGAGPA